MKTGWHDALTLAGISGVAYGLYLIYPPLAWIGGGAVVAFVGVWVQSQRSRK